MRIGRLFCLVLFLSLGFWGGSGLAARAEGEQRLEIYDAVTFEKEGEIALTNIHEKLSFQVADLGDDGQSEIILGGAPGAKPEVVLLRRDGSEISRFSAYGEGYFGGVIVLAGDVNRDGKTDIVTGTRQGGGPHVRVFSASGELISQWFAFHSESRVGMSLAAGDLVAAKPGNEIVVAPGEGEAALLRLFTYQGELLSEWYPFGEDFTGGLNIDVSPDGLILVSRAFGKSPLVRVFNRFGGLVNEFMAYYEGFEGGVQVQAVAQPHGGWDILTAPGFSGGPHVRNFSSSGQPLSPGLMAFEGKYRGGITFDDGDLDGDGRNEVVLGMASMTVGPQQSIKAIVVDLSQQKMYTYYRGLPQKEYWISSGLARFPTPTGEFSVLSKREKTRMTWYYGADNPDNYDLADVPHVLKFVGPFNIHGAYWHHNFGHPMSHGCVNMSLPDAKEVYEWADIGTAVIIRP